MEVSPDFENSLSIPHFLGVDFETSDFYHEGGVPVEVAAILLDSKLVEISRFQTYIKPSEFSSWAQEAENTHKLTREFLSDKPSLEDASKAFMNWLWRYTRDAFRVMPIAHNYQFDNLFLDMLVSTTFRKRNVDYRHVDTMPLAAIINNIAEVRGAGALFTSTTASGDVRPSISLEAMRKYFGISSVGAHGAEKDISDTIDILRKLSDMITLNIGGASF